MTCIFHGVGAGQLRRALACLTAMSAGATERSQLSSLPCWRRAAAQHVPLATSPCASIHFAILCSLAFHNSSTPCYLSLQKG